MTSIFVMVLFATKHLVVDFFMQTEEMVKSKGIYLSPAGVWHSAQHGIATYIVLLTIGCPVVAGFFLSVIDFLTHYHIDYVKMRYGCRDMMTDKFWHQLGLDQYAHYLVYFFIVFIVSILTLEV